MRGKRNTTLPCSVPDCGRPATAGWGWCMRHWQRWRATGHPEGHIPHKKTDPAILHERRVKRFLELVGEANANGCRLWKGKIGTGGYGASPSIILGARDAHRIAYMLEHGKLPSSVFVCHDCPGGDNPACCAPAHMFLGDVRTNTQDAARKGMMHLGEKHGLAKLTDIRVREARSLFRKGASKAELARKYGVGHHTMHCALIGLTWRHVAEI